MLPFNVAIWQGYNMRSNCFGLTKSFKKDQDSDHKISLYACSKACDIDDFTATAKLFLYNFTNFQICCCHDYQWKCWSEPRAHLFTFLASRSSWRSSNSDDGACERNGKAWCEGFACHARLCDGQETRTTPFWGNHWCWACDTSDPKKHPSTARICACNCVLKNLRILVGAIRRFEPDLVHATQEASLQVLVAACMLSDVPLIISLHTDVAQIAARDDGFSSLGGAIGRLHSWSGVFFTHWGYRNWALAGANFFPVSKQSMVILRNAGVPEQRVAPVIWGPMVDRTQFRVDLPEDKVLETRKRLTFGMQPCFLMIYVGRVTAEKDIQFLVDAHTAGS